MKEEEAICFYQFSAYFVGLHSLDCSLLYAFLLVLAAGWLACIQRPRCKYSTVASLVLLVVSIELHLFTTCFCCTTLTKHVAYSNTRGRCQALDPGCECCFENRWLRWRYLPLASSMT
jgi:hypothetical protein